METEKWYQILAHGIGPTNNYGKQEYEAEIFNIDGDYMVFDTIEKMRDFMDNINIFTAFRGMVLGKKLPFVILEIQSIPPIIGAEATTEEWYIYNTSQSMYVGVGNMSINEAIDTYNSLNEDQID